MLMEYCVVQFGTGGCCIWICDRGGGNLFCGIVNCELWELWEFVVCTAVPEYKQLIGDRAARIALSEWGGLFYALRKIRKIRNSCITGV